MWIKDRREGSSLRQNWRNTWEYMREYSHVRVRVFKPQHLRRDVITSCDEPPGPLFMRAGFHLKKSNPALKNKVEREEERDCTHSCLYFDTLCNSIMCVSSHLEVSVYYTLLMAILHRWHNLESEKKWLRERQTMGTGETGDKDDTMDELKWLENEIRHSIRVSSESNGKEN